MPVASSLHVWEYLLTTFKKTNKKYYMHCYSTGFHCIVWQNHEEEAASYYSNTILTLYNQLANSKHECKINKNY